MHNVKLTILATFKCVIHSVKCNYISRNVILIEGVTLCLSTTVCLVDTAAKWWDLVGQESLCGLFIFLKTSKSPGSGVNRQQLQHDKKCSRYKTFKQQI